MLSPLNRKNSGMNRTQAAGVTFLTHLNGQEDPVDLLDLENRKAARNSVKGVTKVKLQILDDFKRLQMAKELTTKAEKASRAARQALSQTVKLRKEESSKGRDEKLRMLKITRERDARIDQEREYKRMKDDEQVAAKRLAELEAKRAEEIKKKEHDYLVKRQAVIRFGKQKELNEIEMGNQVMRTLESKFGLSDQL